MSPISAFTAGFVLLGIAGLAGAGLVGGSAATPRRRVGLVAGVFVLIFAGLVSVRLLNDSMGELPDVFSYALLILGSVAVVWVFWRRYRKDRSAGTEAPRNQFVMSLFIVAFVWARAAFGDR